MRQTLPQAARAHKGGDVLLTRLTVLLLGFFEGLVAFSGGWRSCARVKEPMEPHGAPD
jgi:hypothetical protein